MPPIRVLIADDHRLFAEALEVILSTDERIAVAGTARDGREAVEELRRRGLEAGVLMLTGSNARDDVDRARQAGAAGYVTKDRIAAELIDAIVEVASR